MEEFRYRGIEASGATVTGNLQALNGKGAYSALKQSGITPISIWQADFEVEDVKWWQRDIALFSSKIPPQHLSVTAKAIALLLNAGLPINDALDAAIESSPKPMKPILISVIRQIAQGEKISAAFARHREKLPDTFLMMIDVGEIANRLPDTFLRAASHFDRQAENARKLVGALIYPAILVLFAVFLLGVLVFFLVPALEPLFASSGMALPTMLSILVQSKLFLFNNGIFILATLIAIPIVVSALRATPSGKKFLQSLALRIPYLGKRLVLADLARFTHALSVMLESGLSFQNSMQAGCKTFHLLSLRELAQDALDEMKQGGSFTDFFSQSPLIGKDIKQLMLLAEKTNQWQKIMEETANTLDAQIEEADRKITNLITPFITVFIGTVIGILVVSVISAILEINELAFQ